MEYEYVHSFADVASLLPAMRKNKLRSPMPETALIEYGSLREWFSFKLSKANGSYVIRRAKNESYAENLFNHLCYLADNVNNNKNKNNNSKSEMIALLTYEAYNYNNGEEEEEEEEERGENSSSLQQSSALLSREECYALLQCLPGHWSVTKSLTGRATEVDVNVRRILEEVAEHSFVLQSFVYPLNGLAYITRYQRSDDMQETRYSTECVPYMALHRCLDKCRKSNVLKSVLGREELSFHVRGQLRGRAGMVIRHLENQRGVAIRRCSLEFIFSTQGDLLLLSVYDLIWGGAIPRRGHGAMSGMPLRGNNNLLAKYLNCDRDRKSHHHHYSRGKQSGSNINGTLSFTARRPASAQIRTSSSRRCETKEGTRRRSRPSSANAKVLLPPDKGEGGIYSAQKRVVHKSESPRHLSLEERLDQMREENVVSMDQMRDENKKLLSRLATEMEKHDHIQAECYRLQEEVDAKYERNQHFEVIRENLMKRNTSLQDEVKALTDRCRRIDTDANNKISRLGTREAQTNEKCQELQSRLIEQMDTVAQLTKRLRDHFTIRGEMADIIERLSKELITGDNVRRARQILKSHTLDVKYNIPNPFNLRIHDLMVPSFREGLLYQDEMRTINSLFLDDIQQLKDIHKYYCLRKEKLRLDRRQDYTLEKSQYYRILEKSIPPEDLKQFESLSLVSFMYDKACKGSKDGMTFHHFLEVLIRVASKLYDRAPLPGERSGIAGIVLPISSRLELYLKKDVLPKCQSMQLAPGGTMRSRILVSILADEAKHLSATQREKKRKAVHVALYFFKEKYCGTFDGKEPLSGIMHQGNSGFLKRALRFMNKKPLYFLAAD